MDLVKNQNSGIFYRVYLSRMTSNNYEQYHTALIRVEGLLRGRQAVANRRFNEVNLMNPLALSGQAHAYLERSREVETSLEV